MSNDEIDEEINNSTKNRGKYMKTHSHHNMITKQRSLTPDRISDSDQPHPPPHQQLPVGRSLTPEKFRLKNGGSDGSQGSLFVKHSSSSSRGSTLERPQYSDDKVNFSSSSSSTSSSGDDELTRAKRNVDRQNEYRIRRSRFATQILMFPIVL